MSTCSNGDGRPIAWPSEGLCAECLSALPALLLALRTSPPSGGITSTRPVQIVAVISGGQTGADQGALFGAQDIGIQTGGTAPRGWRTEAGPAPWLANYGLRKSAAPGYASRTRENVANSDATIIVGNVASAGSRLTRQLCWDMGRPVLVVPWCTGAPIPDAGAGERFLRLHHVYVVNVAGNRESVMPGIEGATREYVARVCAAGLSRSRRETTP